MKLSRALSVLYATGLLTSLVNIGIQSVAARVPDYDQQCRDLKAPFGPRYSGFNWLTGAKCINYYQYQLNCLRSRSWGLITDQIYGFSCHDYEFCQTVDGDGRAINLDWGNVFVSYRAVCISVRASDLRILRGDNTTANNTNKKTKPDIQYWDPDAFPMPIDHNKSHTMYSVASIMGDLNDTGAKIELYMGSPGVPRNLFKELGFREIPEGDTEPKNHMYSYSYKVDPGELLVFQSEFKVMKSRHKGTLWLNQFWGWL